VRLHRGGRWRAWLGARLGGDVELGDRAWRRCLHGTGALLLVYYLVPPGTFVVLTNPEALLIALAAALGLEASRWLFGLELPTLRAHENDRPASFAYFALALVLALLLFPRPVAVAVVLGAAFVDPLIGELRLRPSARAAYPVLPVLVYAGLAAVSFHWVGGFSLPATAALALAAGVIGVAAERPRLRYLDDDFTMVIVPGAILALLLFLVPGLAGVGA
jgi:hypothetical protein